MIEEMKENCKNFMKEKELSVIRNRKENWICGDCIRRHLCYSTCRVDNFEFINKPQEKNDKIKT
jgi:radical SAM protein with 4Fe4S-binding SPASM domain